MRGNERDLFVCLREERRECREREKINVRGNEERERADGKEGNREE